MHDPSLLSGERFPMGPDKFSGLVRPAGIVRPGRFAKVRSDTRRRSHVDAVVFFREKIAMEILAVSWSGVENPWVVVGSRG